MARKKKQSPFEDIIELTAMLPWWGGVLLALIAYFVLHHYATAEVAAASSVAKLGANVTSQIGKTLAMFGQYLLPFAFIIGAGVSSYGRNKRGTLLSGVQASSSVSALNDMSWQEFELLVGEAFRRKGYAVAENGGGGADGGVDLVLRKGNEKYLVQCKQWKAFKVGVTTIRELYGVMAAGGATGGFVVTSGVFTQEAKDFADGRNIDLIDGVALKKFISKVQPDVAPRQVVTQAQTTDEQACPNCGGAMIRRTAKQGANAGKAFWGCSNFPQCRGIVPID